ncbi:pectate lyase [Streptomyces sporangiiformans]|uniref:pectate lyase n=2 Tax=Streptomyces sporangiiformans TaxID=2315329 RepID=A0A505DQS3_9ACTN|nr:pectate lyase [Streptomyces sporangiiformans]
MGKRAARRGARRGGGKRRRSVLIGVVAVALAGGAVTGWALVSSSASEPEPEAGTYRLVNASDGMCLTASSSDTQPAAAACDGAAAQQWQLAESGGGFTVKAVAGGRCAGVESTSTSAGKAVRQQTCGKGPSQVWKPRPAGKAYDLVNAASGQCLNVRGGLAQQNPCDQASRKSWKLMAVTGSSPSSTKAPSSPSPATRSATSSSASPSKSKAASKSKNPKASDPSSRTPSTSTALGAWPTATAGRTVSATIEVSGSYDGGLRRYSGSGALGSDGQDEDQGPLFELADGAVLQNVILGSPAADGVHCLGSCTLRNVWWEDVGEDAATFKGTSASARYLVVGGGARNADDKVLQHNGAGTLTIKNFQVENFGKLYRSCGNCETQYERHVVVSNVRVTGPGKALVGVNVNYGDTATLSGITFVGGSAKEISVCRRFQGNDTGDEPTTVGSGPDGTHCRYTPSDITYG